MIKVWSKISLFTVFVITCSIIQAQQFPFWTQHRSNLYLCNPAVTGTRKTVDARASFRRQWMGFDGAPVTSTLSVHGRFWKGRMGAGGFIYTDKIGPSSFTTYGLSYAYHIRFPDTELSIGMNGSYSTQLLDPNKITYHNSHDQLLENALIYTKAKIPNAAIGVLYYNDRFYIGAAVNNLLGSTYTFSPATAVKKPEMKTVQHYNFSVGYNWDSDPNFVFENSVFANYVPGTPILLDYNLRLHIKHAFFVGAGIRMKNAVIAQVGFTIDQSFQIAYSYDYNINRLHSFNSGSHEIKLVYVYDKDKNQKHRQGHGFEKQKYQNML